MFNNILFRCFAHGVSWATLAFPMVWGTLTDGQRNGLNELLDPQVSPTTFVEGVSSLMGGESDCSYLSTCRSLLKEKTSADRELVEKVLKAYCSALSLQEAASVAFAEKELWGVFSERCLEYVKELTRGIVELNESDLAYLENLQKHIEVNVRSKCGNFTDIGAYLAEAAHNLIDAHSTFSQKDLALPSELVEKPLADLVFDKLMSKLIAAGGKPGQALRISPDGKSLEPFYPAGAISFYAYLDPDKPFTTSASESWEIVPLDSVMYDSANAFNIQDHAFHVPLKGNWLFIAKVWCGENATDVPMSLALCDNFTTKMYDMTFPRFETSYVFSKEPSGDARQNNRLRMASTVGTYHVNEDNCKVAMMVCAKGKSITVNGDAAPGQGRTALFGVYLGE